MHEKERYTELADFLRTRRARITPEQVGLPVGKHRRTPGLRREEVAVLAEVSVEWYTRLEQGREIQVSHKTLEQIASALLLNCDERIHLFHLAGQSVPLNRQTQREEAVSPALQRYLDALGTNPAYILDKHWDRLAWNTAACAVFDDFAALPTRDRNVIWSIFTRPARRRLFVNWEEVAQYILAKFRVSYGQYAGDPYLVKMVEDLQRVSPEFRRWWKDHQVRRDSTYIKYIEHPLCGRMALEHHVFLVPEKPTLQIVVYTPLAEENTTQKIERLVDLYTSNARARVQAS